MKLRFLAIVALMLGVLTAGIGTASANQRIEMSVTDGWILEPVEGSSVYQSILGFDPGAEPVKLSGIVESSGDFTIPAGQLEFKPQVLTTGMLGTVDMTFRATDEITGNYSEKTGAMSMNIPMKWMLSSYVLDESGPSPDLIRLNCQFDGLNGEFQTSGSITTNTVTFRGLPFADGNGQLLGGWTVPASSLVGSGFDGTPDEDCQGGTGSGTITEKFWFRADITTVDLPNEKIELKPKSKKVAAGKSTSLKLRVQNLTDTRRSVKVNLKSSNPNVRVKRSIKVSVPARAVFLADVKVSAGKKAKGKAKITATTGGRKTVSTVTVKPAG